MSKIGKINITIPEKVKVAINGSILNIDGPLGKQSLNIDTKVFDLDIKEGKEISIKPKKINEDIKRLWGMNRSLVNNAIIGTSSGYEKTLASLALRAILSKFSSLPKPNITVFDEVFGKVSINLGNI